MPGRNVLKSDASESFYHVYVRGGNKSRIFREDADYEMFLQLFARYLSLVEVKNSAGVSYPNYSNRVELLAFCLMPNHVHILLYQYSQHDMTEFMRSLLTSYSMYFNHKYKRTGPLFESRYKASLVSDDAYLHHISRYIHLNPRQWKEYPYSSLPYYLQQVSDDWIVPRRVAELFEGPTTYLQFLDDHVEHKEMLDILKHELANEI